MSNEFRLYSPSASAVWIRVQQRPSPTNSTTLTWDGSAWVANPTDAQNAAGMISASKEVSSDSATWAGYWVASLPAGAHPATYNADFHDSATIGQFTSLGSCEYDNGLTAADVQAWNGSTDGLISDEQTGLPVVMAIDASSVLDGHYPAGTAAIAAAVGNAIPTAAQIQSGLATAAAVAAIPTMPLLAADYTAPDNASIGTIATAIQSGTYGLSALQTLIAAIPTSPPDTVMVSESSVTAIQSGLATATAITDLQSHGDSAWATATGFASASDLATLASAVGTPAGGHTVAGDAGNAATQTAGLQSWMSGVTSFLSGLVTAIVNAVLGGSQEPIVTNSSGQVEASNATGIPAGMLQSDGAGGEQFTAKALAEGPASDPIVNILPGNVGSATNGGTPIGLLPQAWQHSCYTASFPVVDSSGNAINLSGVGLTMDFWDPNISPLTVALQANASGSSGATISIGGTASNIVTLTITPTAAGIARTWKWLLRPTSNTSPPYVSGQLTIQPAPVI